MFVQKRKLIMQAMMSPLFDTINSSESEPHPGHADNDADSSQPEDKPIREWIFREWQRGLRNRNQTPCGHEERGKEQ
jgi:hypothetical protein